MKALVALACFVLTACGKANQKEAARLGELLGWKSGQTVADIGAGNGAYAVAAAQVVGPSGLVYATEVDEGKLKNLKRKVKKYPNLRVVSSTDADAGLPAECCDSAMLRGVYHHLTKPESIDASLLRALKAHGRLAVIDFPPKRFLSWFFPVRGVPANRGGHGVSMPIVVEELTKAGFHIDQQISEWPGGHYCVVASKP